MKYKNAISVSPKFSYSSDNNDDWLSGDLTQEQRGDIMNDPNIDIG